MNNRGVFIGRVMEKAAQAKRDDMYVHRNLQRKGFILVRKGTRNEDRYQARDYLWQRNGEQIWFDYKGTDRDIDFFTVQHSHLQRWRRGEYDKLPDLYAMYTVKRHTNTVSISYIHPDELFQNIEDHGEFVQKYQKKPNGALQANHYWKVPKNLFTFNWL
jgi:hypothetical protein